MAAFEADVDDELEAEWGVECIAEAGTVRRGYLLTIQETVVVDEADQTSANPRSGIYLYFVAPDASVFRVIKLLRPSILVRVRTNFATVAIEDRQSALYHAQSILEAELNSASSRMNVSVDIVDRICTEGSSYLQKNASQPYVREEFVKVDFENQEEMIQGRYRLQTILRRTEEIERELISELRQQGISSLKWDPSEGSSGAEAVKRVHALLRTNPIYFVGEIFEHDLEYASKFFIEHDLRCGKWYDVNKASIDAPIPNAIQIVLCDDEVQKIAPPLRILAWDIETHKAPLKFPDPSNDPIMCISYMLNSSGFLLVNREYFGRDIRDFEYHPNSSYTGSFRVYNFRDEKSLLRFFFDHVKYVLKPHIIVTYNGDSFDFPYTAERALRHDLSLLKSWGFHDTAKRIRGFQPKPQFTSRFIPHIDCYKWVERDSYLPCGSRGLKAVTKAKLGYEPREVDPELMVEYSRHKPQVMAEYSVSDSVATISLYNKYIHRFTLALASIIPLPPDDVLRKGSGTLCEALLMAEAFKRQILIPNRKTEEEEKWLDDKYLLISETYVGGNVEQLRSGIFRSDIPEVFTFDAAIIDEMLQNLDLTFDVWMRRECNVNGSLDIVRTNWDEIRVKIEQTLAEFKERGTMKCCPMIYHLDVGAMYPNIILTQRLQPYAIMSGGECEKCAWREDAEKCQRSMNWTWKAERFPLSRSQVNVVKDQLSIEMHTVQDQGGDEDGPKSVKWSQLTLAQRQEKFKQRLKYLSLKTSNNKFKIPVEKSRYDIVCQRAASFYVDTVRDFRDRRGVYKKLKKKAESKLEDALPGQITQVMNEVSLFDSLQLAHKCILNSFYGYVMRKGARWYSLEMAAIVTHTGAQVIKKAKKICEGIGAPLELDTDGVWTLLPTTFPNNFTIEIETRDGTKLTRKFSYPCWLLNTFVEKEWLNEQFLTLETETGTYSVSSVNSIFFEIDGPYKAMFLPASEKEGQQLKKRYAVFDNDGHLVELKGFELKRRGELSIIKMFQENVFPAYLKGSDRKSIYASAADVAKNWLRFITSKGEKAEDWRDILQLVSESKTLSKPVVEQKGYKSMGITAAIRLTDLLQDETYIRDAGVKAEFVISAYPTKAEKTSRAVPVSVFNEETEKQDYWLSKWTSGDDEKTTQHKLFQDSRSTKNLSVKEKLEQLLDWAYYRERLAVAIQKIVTLPAVSQNLPNPVLEVSLPDWLRRNLEKRMGRQKHLSLAPRPAPPKDLPSQSPSRLPSVPEEKMTDQGAAQEENLPPQTSVENFLEKLVRSSLPAWQKYRKSQAASGAQWHSVLWSDKSAISHLLEEPMTLVDLDLSLLHSMSATFHTSIVSPSSAWAYLKPDHSCQIIRVLIQQPVLLEIEGCLDHNTLSAILDSMRSDYPAALQWVSIGSKSPKIATLTADWLSFTHLLPHILGHHFINPSHAKICGMQIPRLHDVATRLGARVSLARVPDSLGSVNDYFLVPATQVPGERMPTIESMAVYFDFILSPDGMQFFVVQFAVDNAVSIKHCSARGLVSAHIKQRLMESRIRDVQSAVLRMFRIPETAKHKVVITVCDGLCDALGRLKKQQVMVSKLLTRSASLFVVGVSESLYEFTHHELLYPDSSRVEVCAPILVYPISHSIFKDYQTATLNADSYIWKSLIFKICNVLNAVRKALLNAKTIDVPIGTCIRLICQAECDPTQLWDLYFARTIKKNDVTKSSLIESLPRFTSVIDTSPRLLERDLLEALDGGPCHDGTQVTSIANKLKHYIAYKPRFVKPGLYRNQIVHIRFHRPIMLQALLKFERLAHLFDIALDGTYYEIKMSKDKRKKKTFFVREDKKQSGEKSKSTNESSKHAPLVKEELYIDPILKDFLYLGKLLKDHINLAADKSVLNWLVDHQSSLFDPRRRHYMTQKLVSLIFKVIIESISGINERIGLEISPIALWDTGLLLQFPTTQPAKAKTAAEIVLRHLASNEILDGLIDPGSQRQYRHGLQIDYRNNLFLNNDDDLEYISFPYLESLPPQLASVVEENLVHILNEPLAAARNRSGVRFPSRELVQQMSASWLDGEWGPRINGLVSYAINRAEEEALIFDSQALGLIECELDVKTALQRFLVHVALLDTTFASKSEDDLRTWIANFVDDDFYLEGTHQYASTVPILLPDMVCERCQSIECLDLTVPSQDGIFECINCSHPFDEGIIESKLMELLENHLLSQQNREINCMKCRQLKRIRCAKCCECGNKFCFATSQMDTSLLFKALRSLTSNMDLPWLQSMLDLYHELVPASVTYKA